MKYRKGEKLISLETFEIFEKNKAYSSTLYVVVGGSIYWGFFKKGSMTPYWLSESAMDTLFHRKLFYINPNIFIL